MISYMEKQTLSRMKTTISELLGDAIMLTTKAKDEEFLQEEIKALLEKASTKMDRFKELRERKQ